jgi:hypothetical protein
MGAQTIVTREPFFFAKLFWRFGTGNFMDGIRRGDSTWIRRASDRQGRLNAWTRMSRLQRALVRWSVVLYTLTITVALIWARDLAWLVLGLGLAYWLARLGIWLDHKLFHRYHVQDSEGRYRLFRTKHHRVQKRIDTLPDPVAKLFGGKTQL